MLTALLIINNSNRDLGCPRRATLILSRRSLRSLHLCHRVGLLLRLSWGLPSRKLALACWVVSRSSLRSIARLAAFSASAALSVLAFLALGAILRRLRFRDFVAFSLARHECCLLFQLCVSSASLQTRRAANRQIKESP